MEEQIIYALQLADSGKAMINVCRQLGVSETTFYTWKKKYTPVRLLALPVRPRRGCGLYVHTKHAALPVQGVDPASFQSLKRSFVVGRVDVACTRITFLPWEDVLDF